ncbi:DUF4136 domain-containing protein [Paraflavitalea pollutisoli]|uniref:DUF4136 domain-containing protein n=1 Tax=Paraflavitalea pollutisoli TaxID=3034143 RepID=UPI0023EADCE2|nr:DUF4136 domain-containing protein [Paraflavitalea sp. H1-2-19X]
MQKIHCGLAAIVLLCLAVTTSCRKTPSLDKLSSDFVVETKYDNTVNFKEFKTFAIRDTIALSTDNPKDSVWYDKDAQSIISEVIKQLTAYGYTRVAPGAAGKADLGVQLVAIRNKTMYNVTPGYWWGYPGYGDPWYWGDYYDWYYYTPYYYSYSIKTGTLAVEIVDLKDAKTNQKLNIVWTGIGSGQIGNAQAFLVDQCIKSVDQAFAQSPYLKQ